MPENIDLGKVQAQAAKDDIWALRGHSIQAFATLEQSLCSLFSELSGTERDVAGIIFFKIINTGARNAILEKLFKRRFKGEYSAFFNSYIAEVRKIDEKRNQIVHWNSVTNVGSEGYKHMALTPPSGWIPDQDSPSITNEHLSDFIKKCSFLSRLCNMFTFSLSATGLATMPEDQRTAWLDTWRRIFQQPVVCLPPDTHPLYQSSLKLETHSATFVLS